MSWFNKKAKPTETTDELLLEKYRSIGDLVFLGQLFEKYMPLIYGVCLKYLADEEKAKDAVMAIFEELVQKVNNFEIRNFKSWLYVLTRNYCLMQIRAGYRFKYESITDVMEFGDVLHPEYEDREQHLNLLELCLQSLSIAQKQCVDLFYLKEKSYKEISEVTDYTFLEVKSHIQNGKRNLKICMEKNNEQ